MNPDYATTLIVSNVPADGQLTCQAGPRPAGGFQVLVAFSGPVFTPEDCQELLQPPRDDRQFAGDLGPALAAAIVRWHGGELTAQPGDPQGLTFTLTLPPPPTGHEDGTPPE